MLDVGSRVAFAGAALLFLAGASLLLSGGEQAATSLEVPEPAPGTTAEFEVRGDRLQNLGALGPLNSGPPPETVIVKVEERAVLGPQGQLVPARIVAVNTVEGTSLWEAAMSAQGPLVSGVSVHTSGSPGQGLPPLAGLRFAVDPPDPKIGPYMDTGFGDVFLFGGATLEDGALRVGDLQPWAPGLLHVSGEDWSLADVPLRTSVSRDASQIVANITLTTPGISSLEGARYRFTQGCPFPHSVAYTLGNGSRIVAERTSCEVPPGSAQPLPASPSSSTDLVPFEKAFPGLGDELPLPYHEALAYALSLEEVETFSAANPDWVLDCATLDEDAPELPIGHNWTWGFHFQAPDGEMAVSVTRYQLPTEPAPTWKRDPDPPRSPCSAEPDAWASLPGTPFATVDEMHRRFQWMLDEEAWGRDADLDSFRVSPEGGTFLLSRCDQKLDEEGGGFCGEIAPDFRMTPQGKVDEMSFEPEWAPAPLRALVR